MPIWAMMLATAFAATPNEKAEAPEPFFLVGAQMEFGLFSSGDINRTITDSLPSSRITRQGFEQAVLLLGIGAFAEMRPLPYVGVAPYAAYLFSPKALAVEGSDGLETEFFNPHAFAFGAMGRAFVPLGSGVDLALGAGPALYLAAFRGNEGTGIGVSANAGVQLDADFADVRAYAYFRWAPIPAGSDYTLNFTSAGFLADFAIKLL